MHCPLSILLLSFFKRPTIPCKINESLIYVYFVHTNTSKEDNMKLATQGLILFILALVGGCTDVHSYNMFGDCPIKDYGTVIINGNLRGHRNPMNLEEVSKYVETDLCVRRAYVFNVEGKPDSWNEIEVELAIPPNTASSFYLLLQGFKGTRIQWRSPSHDLFMTLTVSENETVLHYSDYQPLILEERVSYYAVTAHPKER